jgi:hypothetical protein
MRTLTKQQEKQENRHITSRNLTQERADVRLSNVRLYVTHVNGTRRLVRLIGTPRTVIW